MKHLFLFAALLLFACSRPAAPGDGVRRIRVDAGRVEALRLEEWFSEVSYVPLSDDLLIGTVERAKVRDGKLLVLADGDVSVFDVDSGRALLRVSHEGAGPGEYVSLSDMLYDSEADAVEVLDRNGRKVLRYGMDGRFAGEVRLPFSPFAFRRVAPSRYLFYNNNMVSEATDCRLVLYDAEASEVVGAYFPVDRHLATYFFVLDAGNFGSGTNVSFHFAASDTVYGFTDACVPRPKYVIDFGAHRVPPRFYGEDYEDIRDFSEQAARNGYIYMYGNFQEEGNVAAFSFHRDGEVYWVLYDSELGTATVVNRWTDGADAGAEVGIAHGNGPFALDDGYMYFFLPPDQLIELAERADGAGVRVNGALNRIRDAYGFSEESNPVLVKCRLKFKI